LRAQWRYRNTPIVVVWDNPEHGPRNGIAARAAVYDPVKRDERTSAGPFESRNL
jgi:hypothetical protein